MTGVRIIKTGRKILMINPLNSRNISKVGKWVIYLFRETIKKEDIKELFIITTGKNNLGWKMEYDSRI